MATTNTVVSLCIAGDSLASNAPSERGDPFSERDRVKILGLIPARGGSKGILRKNIKVIAGKPLIAWTIEAALRSRFLDAVIVSTDDEEIATVARQCGAQVPFMRPAALADDFTPGLDPVFHALSKLPEFDSVLLLQPTSPLRTTDDIDSCIDMAKKNSAPCVVSVSEPDVHPYWVYRLNDDQTMRALVETHEAVNRRQDLPLVYALNGALYFANSLWLTRQQKFMTDETAAYVMSPERSIDIDTPLDWKLAELLLREKYA